MANLMDSVENSVWHAFDFLALDGDGTAPKSKLKVWIQRSPIRNFDERQTMLQPWFGS